MSSLFIITSVKWSLYLFWNVISSRHTVPVCVCVFLGVFFILFLMSSRVDWLITDPPWSGLSNGLRWGVMEEELLSWRGVTVRWSPAKRLNEGSIALNTAAFRTLTSHQCRENTSPPPPQPPELSLCVWFILSSFSCCFTKVRSWNIEDAGGYCVEKKNVFLSGGRLWQWAFRQAPADTHTHTEVKREGERESSVCPLCRADLLQL